MRWWWQKGPENVGRSIADPTLAALFSPGGTIDLTGIPVGEQSVLGLSAMFRAVSLVSQQLAALPMPTYSVGPNDTRQVVESVFDRPDGDTGQTVFEWKESMIANAMIHGRAYAMINRYAAGGVASLPIVHPVCVRTEEPTQEEFASLRPDYQGPAMFPVGGLWHIIDMGDGRQVKLDGRDVLYVPGLSTDGRYPWGLINVARTSLRTSIAADRAAGNMFLKGALISGLATPEGEEDITDDVAEIRRQLNSATAGQENAGAIAIINRRLKFTPWTMTATDAQFMQSREFQIEEISRWTGVPPHLLMQTSKQSSWGTGIEEQNRALGRTVLATWANRFEHRLSRLLAFNRYVKFDFRELERPSPQDEQNMLVNLVNAGVITPNEARKKLHWEPIEGGNSLRNGQDMGAGVNANADNLPPAE
jgi:HK97 family phage portal protein